LTNSHSKSNQARVETGQDLMEGIRLKLEDLKADNVITDYKQEFNVPEKGFSYQSAYLANFLIEVDGGKFIVVRTTTSFRQDRLKMHFYDLRGINENSEFSEDIIASIYLLPNNAINNSGFNSFRQRMFDGEQYVPFTHCLVWDEFLDFLFTFSNSKQSYVEILEETFEDFDPSYSLPDNPTETELGSFYSMRGTEFVRDIVRQLNSKEWLPEYRVGHSTNNPFEGIVDNLRDIHNLDKKEMLSLHASDTIKVLRSGGNAKTDFYIELTTTTNKTIVETYSVKTTSKPTVTCHEYPAERFVDIFNCSGSRLEEYLYKFQELGSFDFKEAELEEFTNLISPNIRTLTEWAVSGKHDLDNLIDPSTQIANHILINNRTKIMIDKSSVYIDRLLHLDNSRKILSTPFSWTRSSNNRPTIQLKMPILN